MKKTGAWIIALLLFWSCTDDEQPPQTSAFPIEPGQGVFILNEGGFNAGNASVDYLRFSDNELFGGLFESQNDQPLGDVLQSMTVFGDQAYLVVNNSQKILAVNPDDLKQTAEIGPFTSPRYLHSLPSGQAYVSDLFSNWIYRVDLNTQQKLPDSIQVNGWTEEMARVGGEVFVVNRFTKNILIIDTLTHQLGGEIEVGFDPTSIVTDKEGKLWVLCSGDAASTDNGGLWQIDPQTRMVVKTLAFDDFNTGIAPKVRINGEGDELFFLKGDIYRMAIDDAGLPASPIVPAAGRALYSLEIHPLSGEIFTSDAVDFTQRGTVYRYTRDGTEIQNFKAGVNPNGFFFY